MLLNFTYSTVILTVISQATDSLDLLDKGLLKLPVKYNFFVFLDGKQWQLWQNFNNTGHISDVNPLRGDCVWSAEDL